MPWTFIWLMLILKIPIGGILWIVWWAVHQTDEEPATDGGGGGGSKQRLHHDHRRPRPHAPRHPRRGPHAGAPPPAPARTRTVVAFARRVEH